MPGSAVEDTHTIGLRSARAAPIEVITRGARRRIWSAEQKRGIVAERLGPELTPTEVARKHAISSGLLYRWRQQVLGDQLGLVTRAAPSFAQVEMTAAPRQVDASASKLLEPVPPPVFAAVMRPDELIEIVLPGGVSVRVGALVDARALRRVLGALEGR